MRPRPPGGQSEADRDPETFAPASLTVAARDLTLQAGKRYVLEYVDSGADWPTARLLTITAAEWKPADGARTRTLWLSFVGPDGAPGWLCLDEAAEVRAWPW